MPLAVDDFLIGFKCGVDQSSACILFIFAAEVRASRLGLYFPSAVCPAGPVSNEEERRSAEKRTKTY